MHTIMNFLARLCAFLGGIALSALILITCFSILGRLLSGVLHSEFIQSYVPVVADKLLALGVGPINGDFEIVEAGMAFAIFAFLPLCQLNGAHASVDIFTSRFSDKARRPLIMLIEIVFAVTLIVIAIQLFAGMQSKRNSGQLTFLLQYPIWWAYALSLTGAVVASVVSVYVASIRVIEVITGRDCLPVASDAAH